MPRKQRSKTVIAHIGGGVVPRRRWIIYREGLAIPAMTVAQDSANARDLCGSELSTGGRYFPCQFGFRFSRNAAIPSALSALG